jgi:2-amino-4-hydroxy-6-hydroxymethyldihydropteridine diphosphokinase
MEVMKILIGLGGNLGDPARAFTRAAAALAAGHRVLAASALWRSAAVGPPQPDFLNAALLVETSAGPRDLLAECHDLETAAGRTRERDERWGPRPLDLDLLLAQDTVVVSGGLTLPHPCLHERAFALLPAAELAPDWVHPRLGQRLSTLAAGPMILTQRCQRVGRFPLP